MALIKQIKVGGTTYNIGINAAAPLSVSGDDLRLNIGSGLHTLDDKLDVFLSGDTLENKSGIAVKVTTGLATTKDGIMLLVSGYDSNYNRGFTLEKGVLELKLGSGLRFNEDGTLDLA